MRRGRPDKAPDDASRRDFLRAAALGGAAAWVLPAAGAREAGETLDARPAAPADGRVDSRLFSGEQQRALSTLADHVLPGAGAWGAVDYIEALLTSLDGPVPRIYAGPAGAGESWLPLDRVRRLAWRLRIHGSDAVQTPAGMLREPVRGLRPLMLAGADEAAGRFARGQSPRRVWWGLPSDFRDRFSELVLEGSLGDPIYGGNRGGEAWRRFHFEGAMLGYGSQAPAHAGHGERGGEAAGAQGPAPLGSFTRAALWALGFFSRRIAMR